MKRILITAIVSLSMVTHSFGQAEPTTVADLIDLVKAIKEANPSNGGVLSTYTEAQLAIALGQQVVHNSQLLQHHSDQHLTVTEAAGTNSKNLNEASSTNVKSLNEASATAAKAADIIQTSVIANGSDRILRPKALDLKEAQTADLANLNTITNDLQAVQQSLQSNAAILGAMSESLKALSGAANKGGPTPGPAASVDEGAALKIDQREQVAALLKVLAADDPEGFEVVLNGLLAAAKEQQQGE